MKLSKEAKRLNKAWLKGVEPSHFQLYDFPSLEEAKESLNLAIKEGSLTEPEVKECSLESLYLWRALPNGKWLLDSVDLEKERVFICAKCRNSFPFWREHRHIASYLRLCKECYKKKHSKICEFCGKSFISKVSVKKYCSLKCARDHLKRKKEERLKEL